MTQLLAAMQQVPDWRAKTAAEVREALSSPQAVKRPKSRANANDLMKLLGTEVANGLASALQAAGLPLVVASLATPDGIDFADDETQRMLAKLATDLPGFAPYVTALREIGIDSRTLWEKVGEGDLPSEQAIGIELRRAELMALSEQRRLSDYAAIETAFDARMAAIAAWDGTDPEPEV